MANPTEQVVGLDIGTSRVRCVIGEPAENGKLNVIGAGVAESKGLRSGIVTTTKSVVESISKAVEEAERVSGIEIDSATVNLSGEHLQGESKSGVVAVAGAGREISEDDVQRAIESASAMQLPAGWEIVDRLPQEFIIDGQDGITEPIGMRGSRLEALVHVVSSPSAASQNIIKAVHNAGIQIEQMILEPLAASTGTLTDDDTEYGCALVNMGSEITSMMIFGRGAVQHTAVFPFGGMQFTKDIATGLRVSIADAEKIKRVTGCVAGFLLSDDERKEVIEITPVGRSETRELSKEILTDILQPRAVELLQYIAQEVANSGQQISSGVILTGGTASIRGIVEVAEQVFDAPTRVGYPREDLLEGLLDGLHSPEWAAAIGLALTSMRAHSRGSDSSGRSTGRRVAEWFESFTGKFK
ncbi:MAG: cell division protein FtsA [Acidobacteria bacterium]|nr:MAG: cell division protein FtsA [Acidobacteriota bacterium]REK02299.1 MAG: cell division protein FtsA [Acidobacteriota bacterium]REK13898.1 MAG: cell division protein FtsA [Acidobacteriota bacterium]REK41892.1 MAG: cell division protein FtsA [Acidobacteriota bacterium]